MRGDVLRVVEQFRQRDMQTVSLGQLVRLIAGGEFEVRASVDYCIEGGYLRDATHRIDHGDKRPIESVAITKTGIDLVDRTTQDGGVLFDA